MVSRRSIIKAGLACAAGMSFPYIAKAQNTPIVIGEINSYIPSFANFTTPYRKGWTLALEEINASGGINARPLKVLSHSDQAKPDVAEKLTRYLINDKKVPLLFGTFLSNVGLRVTDIAKELQTPFIAAEPLSDEITLEKGNKYTFRVRPSTYMQAKMLAKEAAKLPVSRWACIAPDYEYGHSAVNNFKTFMEAIRPDVEWIQDEWHPLFAIDGAQVISNLSSKNVDAIFNVSFSADLAQLVSEGDKTGFFQNKSIISLLSGEPEYLSKLTSPSCNGWVVTGYPWDQVETLSHKRFIESYESRFAETPVLGSLVGYTTMQAVATALSKSKDTSADALVNTLEGLYFNSPLGKLHFRPDDHQSSMGAFVGHLEHVKGVNRMTDWYYADGTTFWPTETDIKRRRPS